MSFYLGIDFGTSGARAIAIDPQGAPHIEVRTSYDLGDIATWQAALLKLFEQIPLEIKQELEAIAIDATSATVLLCNSKGQPIEPPLIYSDARAANCIEQLSKIAPPEHVVLSATSSLAKLAWLIQNLKFNIQNLKFLHQADWLSFLLHGKLGISDYHNALKLGYDVEQLRYPDWLLSWLQREFSDRAFTITPQQLLPEVMTPGSVVAIVQPQIAQQLQLNPNCGICAGTTDSTAAFIASVGVSPQLGDAVTSLGSTLVLKILSETRIEAANYGIYSHRFDLHGKILWLVGGASNTGGAVLKQYFTDQELADLSSQIQSSQVSPLDYYPLPKMGERFPINDPHLLPRLEPRPENRGEFLHGLLESMAKIEARGYHLLQQLGASPVNRIYTVGGGATNRTWTQIRSRYLQVPLVPPSQNEAAYGAALLALHAPASTRQSP